MSANVTQYTKEELEAKTVAELKTICDKMNITYTSKTLKAELVDLILKGQE